MTTLLIATRNRHKVGEIQAILGVDVRCVALDTWAGSPVVAENGETFAENAVRKSRGIAVWLSGVAEGRGAVDAVLADDSGLEVDALGGAPGVHSARFAAMDPCGVGNSPDADNNAKLLRLLEGVSEERRQARFRCVMALTPLTWTSAGVGFVGESMLFEGVCEGRIDKEPRGAGGFGYDPLFVPVGQACSFAELGEELKNRISHRAGALGGLKDYLAGGVGSQPRRQMSTI